MTQEFQPPRLTTRISERSSWLRAAALGVRPRIGPLHGGVGAGRLNHGEWNALLTRFVQPDGIDYATMTRVLRLIEAYLSRLAEQDPATFIDADDQLAFYLNAYNAIVIHQVVRSYPCPSIRAIPGAFTRSYPIGRRNLSLTELHGNILRAFGDPRVHAAISSAARGGPALSPEAYVGTTLQSALDAAMRRYLADRDHGARYDAPTSTLWLSSVFRSVGGDFVRPDRMPGVTALLAGGNTPRLVEALRPFLPVALPDRIAVRFLPFDWRLR